MRETCDDDAPQGPSTTAEPGLVVVFSDAHPALHPIRVGAKPVALGREGVGGLLVADARLSRLHARVARTKDGWSVADSQSRNGTFVDGDRVERTVACASPRVLRIGGTVLLFVDDVRPFEGHVIERGERGVAGPALAKALERVAHLARSGADALVTGETGTGKELAAHEFHVASGASGPFVAVNCAALPAGVADRLLFGSVRGAFSGAADAEGHLEAADGGTLLLDEAGEIDPLVQAKLLRVLETREVMRLGSSKGRRVDVRILFTTHRDLRRAVGEGRLRSDLYYRMGSRHVVLPPLRGRVEEIPWLVQRALGDPARTGPRLTADGKFVEACMLRPWPGNVRELFGAVGTAASAAQAEKSKVVRAEHLSAEDGTEMATEMATELDAASAPLPTRESVAAALAQHKQNLSAAARSLGLHRTQLYRLLKQLGVERAGET